MNQILKAKEKRQRIVKYLKSAGRPVGKVDIVKNAQVDGVFDSIMRKTREEYPQIHKIGDKQAALYEWKEAAPAPEPKNKNAEGYSDSTASKAIANVMRQTPTGYPERQKFGELWRTGGNNEYEGILVISAKEGICIGCFVYGSRKGSMKDGYTFTWAGKTGRHWCSLLNIINFQTRNIVSRIEELDDQKKAELRKLLADTLGYEVTKETQIKEVEKEVEVVKEVPVEKIVEKVVEKKVGMTEDEVQELLDAQEKEFERKLLEQKVSIYEKVLFRKGA